LKLCWHVAEALQAPRAGAARFATAVKQLAAAGPAPALLLFSGDVFNPSMLSTITRGKHMVDVMNELGVHAASHGNHDYDFGVETMQQRCAACST
jgi:5'-nucleotidase